MRHHWNLTGFQKSSGLEGMGRSWNETDQRATAASTRPSSVKRSLYYKVGKRAYWPIALLLFGLIAIACTPSSANTAVDENTITVYTALPSDIVGSYLAVFEEENPGVTIQLVNEVTLDLVDRLMAEQEDPQADVVWGLAVSSMLTLEWNYLLTMYAPNGVERIDPIFIDGKQPPQWVGISARSIVLCVNQAELRKRQLPLPASWQDLINPVYRGNLLILSPGQTSVGYLLISTVLQLYGDTAGWEYLAALHENVEGVYANNARGVCEKVLSGEYPIGLTYDYRAYFPDDAVMTVIFPKEGAGWDLEVNGLVRKEHIKDGAKLFMDWAIGDSAMKQYAKDRMITAAATDVEPMKGLDGREISSYLFDLDIAWVAANRERIQKEWMSLYGEDSKLVNTS